MSARRHLALVDEHEYVSPYEARMAAARMFDTLAEIARTGSGWVIDGCDREPIAATMVVTFGADGEPTAMVTGINGDNWQDWRKWTELVADATRAIHDLRPFRVIFAGTEVEPEPTYVRMRNNWRTTEQSREFHAAAKVEQRERYEAEHPWVCGCGVRLKSERGMGSHRRSRFHQLWERNNPLSAGVVLAGTEHATGGTR